jgi:hypothetical protein
MVRMVYPPNAPAPEEVLPFPPPPSRRNETPDEPERIELPSLYVEAKRIAGETMLAPDDQTKTDIQRSRIRRITGSFRLCLDKTGHPEQILPIRSTGFPAYDRELILGMQRWAYAPFLDDGKPMAVCTGITFIYSQR